MVHFPYTQGKITTNDIVNDMDQYAIEQNNAGVKCFVAVGDLDAAMYHFRKALAAKLSVETQLLASTNNSEAYINAQDDMEPVVGFETPKTKFFISNIGCNSSEADSHDSTGATNKSFMNFYSSIFLFV